MKDFEVCDEESLGKMLAKVRAAQEKFATYTQEQVDEIFYRAALAANKMRIPLAKMAVEETGMGIVEDKVIKNHYASEYIYNAYKNTKTCGVIERDEGFGITRIAEPIGVLAAVIPTTNPTSTAIFKCLICLKTRNGLIISPHPREKVHDRGGEGRSRSRGRGRSARGHHRMDRSANRAAFGYDYARGGHDSRNGRSRHGESGVFFGKARARRRRRQHARRHRLLGGHSACRFVHSSFQDVR